MSHSLRLVVEELGPSQILVRDVASVTQVVGDYVWVLLCNLKAHMCIWILTSTVRIGVAVSLGTRKGKVFCNPLPRVAQRHVLKYHRTRKWLAYLLPPADKESYVLSESGMATEENPASPEDNTPLRRLLDETSDIIESPSFAHVLTLLLDTTFSVLIDGKIATLSYKLPPVSADSARVIELTDPNSAKTKVANTLAIFCRQAHVIGSGTNNEYLLAMENVRDLEAFAAVVYSSNFDFEPPEDVGKGTETRPTTSRTSIADEPAFAALGGEASIIEKDSGFEAAWGKAVGKEEAREA